MWKRIALWGVLGGLAIFSLGAALYEPEPQTPEAGLHQTLGH